MMSTNKILKLVLFVLFCNLFNINNTSELISLYLKNKALITSKVEDLKNSQKKWELEKLKFANLTEYIIIDNCNETLEIFNLRFNSLPAEPFLDPINSFNLVLKNKDNSSFTLISKEGMADKIFNIKFDFDFNYVKAFENGTINEKISAGWATFEATKFNYTENYERVVYEINSDINLELKFLEISPNLVENTNLQNLSNKIFNKEVTSIANSVSISIYLGIYEYYIAYQEKTFNLELRTENKNYSINNEFALNPFVFDNQTLVEFKDGSIIDASQFNEEDSKISVFLNFINSDNSTLMNSDFQLFLHKKIFVNLFSLDYHEKKNIRIYEKDLKTYNLPEFNELNVNWLSKFYPAILDTNAPSDNFYIQLTVNSVTYVNYNAKVEFVVFFVKEGEILLEFNLSYYFIFGVELAKNSSGKLGANFYIKNSENLSLISFNLKTSINSRFDIRRFSNKIQELVFAFYANNNYYLLKNYESFSELLNGNEINNFFIEKQGIIFGYVDKNEMKEEKLNKKFKRWSSFDNK